MKTLLEVELPVGIADASGGRHRLAVLRPATARDELKALADFRAHLRPESLLEILLARCVVRLGGLEPLDAGVFARLEAPDRACLEAAYRSLNGHPALAGAVGEAS